MKPNDKENVQDNDISVMIITWHDKSNASQVKLIEYLNEINTTSYAWAENDDHAVKGMD